MAARRQRRYARCRSRELDARGARTLLLGDRSPVLRDPIDVVARASSSALSPSRRDRARRCGRARARSVFTWVVGFLALPRVYDASVAAVLALAAWGEALRLYDAFPAFDIVTHQLVPLLGAPVI